MTYSMERDSRRERGQWRGCHTFSNIICDGDAPANHVPRSGGLKMGQTYYYYVRLITSSYSYFFFYSFSLLVLYFPVLIPLHISLSLFYSLPTYILHSSFPLLKSFLSSPLTSHIYA